MKKIKNSKKSVRIGIIGLILGIMFSIVFNKSNNNVIYLIPILGTIGAIVGAIIDRRKYVVSFTLAKEKLPFLLGSIPYLLAGFDSWGQNDILFFALNILALILNILAFFYISKYSKLGLMFLLLNAIYMWSLSYQYFNLERVYLPYACLIIGLGYFIAIFVTKGKNKNLP